jgi:hypothetical protein
MRLAYTKIVYFRHEGGGLQKGLQIKPDIQGMGGGHVCMVSK